ncbi:MAG: hypothetical protein N4A49_10865 [Marinifilaceae bacterium]|jgi:hypothetical protein|nr:hypothetical protein [Marinifilaceae bacterium]
MESTQKKKKQEQEQNINNELQNKKQELEKQQKFKKPSQEQQRKQDEKKYIFNKQAGSFFTEIEALFKDIQNMGQQLQNQGYPLNRPNPQNTKEKKELTYEEKVRKREEQMAKKREYSEKYNLTADFNPSHEIDEFTEINTYIGLIHPKYIDLTDAFYSKVKNFCEKKTIELEQLTSKKSNNTEEEQEKQSKIEEITERLSKMRKNLKKLNNLFFGGNRHYLPVMLAFNKFINQILSDNEKELDDNIDDKIFLEPDNFDDVLSQMSNPKKLDALWTNEYKNDLPDIISDTLNNIKEKNKYSNRYISFRTLLHIYWIKIYTKKSDINIDTLNKVFHNKKSDTSKNATTILNFPLSVLLLSPILIDEIYMHLSGEKKFDNSIFKKGIEEIKTKLKEYKEHHNKDFIDSIIEKLELLFTKNIKYNNDAQAREKYYDLTSNKKELEQKIDNIPNRKRSSKKSKSEIAKYKNEINNINKEIDNYIKFKEIKIDKYFGLLKQMSNDFDPKNIENIINFLNGILPLDLTDEEFHEFYDSNERDNNLQEKNIEQEVQTQPTDKAKEENKLNNINNSAYLKLLIKKSSNWEEEKINQLGKYYKIINYLDLTNNTKAVPYFTKLLDTRGFEEGFKIIDDYSKIDQSDAIYNYIRLNSELNINDNEKKALQAILKHTALNTENINNMINALKTNKTDSEQYEEYKNENENVNLGDQNSNISVGTDLIAQILNQENKESTIQRYIRLIESLLKENIASIGNVENKRLNKNTYEMIITINILGYKFNLLIHHHPFIYKTINASQTHFKIKTDGKIRQSLTDYFKKNQKIIDFIKWANEDYANQKSKFQTKF